ncbi:MAG TPA: BrnT family toxin [Stellaceae bacterium]|nr:BrnT family toxin [Stellaceae bacterium]
MSSGIPGKESLNVEKHGVDFTTATQIWNGPLVEKIDARRDYREIRIIATGIAEGRLLVVVYTWRGERRRIISARKANSRERGRYEEEIAQRGRAPPDGLGAS